MEPLRTFDSLGPKIGIPMHVRVEKVILLFPSYFFLRMSEIGFGKFLHTKESYSTLKIQVIVTSFRSKEILDC